MSQIKTTNQIKIKTTEKHVYAVSPQHVCYRNANLTFRKVSNFLKQVTKQAEKNYDYDSCRVEGITVLKWGLIIESVPQRSTFIASVFLPSYF